MQLKHWFLILALLVGSQLAFAQADISEAEKQQFVIECVKPLANKDVARLKELVEFPLAGEWGYAMGLNQAGKELTRAEFMQHYDQLFDDQVVLLLTAVEAKHVTVYEAVEEPLELHVTLYWEEFSDGNMMEHAIVFRYQQRGDAWKLVTIQIAG